MKNMHERLEALTEHYIEMSKNVERMFRINLEILEKQEFDKSLYGEAKFVEDRINSYEVKIKEDAINTIALFQPTAGPLRALISIIEGTTMLERMGDLLLDEVQLFRKIEKKGGNYKGQLKLVLDIASKVEEIYMVYITSLVDKDYKKVYTLLALDEEVNDARDEAIDILLDYMKKDVNNVESGNLLLLIMKKYERISDKVMQLSKGLVYNVSGNYIRKQELIQKK